MRFFLSVFSSKIGRIFGRLCICLSFLMLASCGGDDDTRGPASSGVVVVGLGDVETRDSWTWDLKCEENSNAADCEYRYEVTKQSSHTFESDDEYEDIETVNTDDEITENERSGKYYIHVQAKSKSTNNVSPVAKGSVTFVNKALDPDPNSFDVPNSSDSSSIRITVKDLVAGDVVRIYVRGGPDSDNSQQSGFFGPVFNFLSPSNATTSSSSSNICTDANEVGEGTVRSGQTEVTIEVDVNVGEHEYYATIESAGGESSACVKVFNYENTSLPEAPTQTECSSVKESPHWEFIDGMCRPSCGGIARIAGYGGASHARGSVDSCSSLTAKGHSDWEEFDIEDGGRTISSNDAYEVAERGGVCCKRGTASNASPPPTVTGLANDAKPKTSRTFTWSCDEGSCKYRHVINKYHKHTFNDKDDEYGDINTATKGNVDSRTKYYLHVQAASGSQESAVTSVSFILEPAALPKVTGLTDDRVPKTVKVWRWGCDQSSCSYRFAVNKNQTHSFTNESYGPTQIATKRISSASDNGTYYIHVQAKDASGAESEVASVLAILEFSATGTVNVTGLNHDTNAGSSKTWNWDCNRGPCTYRYAINQNQTHTFNNEDSYNQTQTATKTITSSSQDGVYYIHVQAKDSGSNESEVTSVFANLEFSASVVVTGLSHDTNAGNSKTWNWGCNQSSCTYRYVVNKNQTHNFGSASYGSARTTTKTISSSSDNGTYYLHVQAKSGSSESEVTTVLAVLEVSTTTSDVQVTGLSHDTNAGRSKTWNWGCNKNSCEYRFEVNQNQTHNFGSASYGSARAYTKSISSASDNGTYYLHVQARDSSNNSNVSDVKTVLAILEFSTVDVQVTGLSNDDVPKASKTWSWGCNKSSCSYRHAINQNRTHSFGSASYSSTPTTATKAITSASDNGIYYLHVQARDTSNNNESDVTTVLVLLEVSADGDVHVTGLSHDTDPKSSKTWNWSCDKGSCTYRYAINQNQKHIFSGSDSYRASPTSATKRITSSSQNGTYYLHVQAKDSNDNESEVESVLVILRYRSGIIGDLAVTGIEDDVEAKSRKTWSWNCTNNSGSCSYRYVINQSKTHSFPDSHLFGPMQSAEKMASTNADNGTYYLHVQAEDAASNLSIVKSVVVYLSKDPVALTLNCVPDKGVGKGLACSWGAGDESRYTVSEGATHIFDVDDSFGSTASETINVANSNYNTGTTYYLHVQVKDSDDNLSSIETNFITLTAKEIKVKIDEEETKKLNKMSAKWTWECDTDNANAAIQATKPCQYRYAVTQETSHEFDNNDAYGPETTVTKTLAHKDEDGDYYLHVQTKDNDNNVSVIKSSDTSFNLKFELDLELKDPKPHTETVSDEEVPTSLQLHFDKTPTFTLRGVQDDYKVTLYSSSECTDGSNDGSGDPTEDTRISSEVTMSSGQVDITISDDKFTDLITYPIYVGVKESASADTECYAATTADDPTPVVVDDTNKETVVPIFEYTRYKPIFAGGDYTCYLSPRGGVSCWGNDLLYPLEPLVTDVKSITITHSNSYCYLRRDNSNTCSITGTAIAIASGGGSGHVCGILKDNSVECIGNGDEGQLGSSSGGVVDLGCDQGIKDGNGDCPSNGDELKAKAIAAGNKHTCVILLDDNKKNSGNDNNGKVLCWGYNAKGQLGQNNTLNHGADPDSDPATDDPTPVNSLDPVNLGSGRVAKSITAGENHTCALLDNNTVKCWGHNILGQLGQNNVIDYGTCGDANNTCDSSNKAMSSLSAISLGGNAVSIVTGIGSNHTCAVLDNNTVKCWGNNWKGQLGQNDSSTVENDAIGADSDGFLDGSNIVNNRNHGSGTGADVPFKSGSGIKAARSVSSLSTIQFGCNKEGSEGRGTTQSCTSLNNFKLKNPYSIAVGKDHVCALLVTDQASDEGKDFVKCWGANDKKQLNNDDAVDRGGDTTNTVEDAPAHEVYSPPSDE